MIQREHDFLSCVDRPGFYFGQEVVGHGEPGCVCVCFSLVHKKQVHFVLAILSIKLL